MQTQQGLQALRICVVPAASTHCYLVVCKHVRDKSPDEPISMLYWGHLVVMVLRTQYSLVILLIETRNWLFLNTPVKTLVL